MLSLGRGGWKNLWAWMKDPPERKTVKATLFHAVAGAALLVAIMAEAGRMTCVVRVKGIGKGIPDHEAGHE